MVTVDETIFGLPPRHQAALRWFVAHAETVQPWPADVSHPEGPIKLATKAKGIYKPKGSSYALSVRQTLGGPYPDREPLTRDDGSWLYFYFQENEDAAARDIEFTNQGLLACQRDGVPIGVMRQVRKSTPVQYRVLGLAMVLGWDQGYFMLEGFTSSGRGRRPEPGAQAEALLSTPFVHGPSATSIEDLTALDQRTRLLASIVVRRGQGRFRQALLDAYEGRCAISGTDAEPALEAAHIIPYRGPQSHELSNGLLLRVDLHTLFDLGLIAIDAPTWTVLVAPRLRSSEYGRLHLQLLRRPALLSQAPNSDALRAHRAWSGI